MNPLTQKALLVFLTLILLAVLSAPLAAQVYKTVDENGNVVYTDQPPADGSAPVVLRPISVVEAPTYEKAPAATEEDAAQDGAKEMSLKYLRKNYKDFALIAPQQEETIWNPENSITVAWNVGYQLQPGMSVTIFVDGQQQAKTTEQIIPVSITDRGEHTVTAILKDGKNRTVATAEPVVFFIRQPGLPAMGVRVTPKGGG